MFWGQAQARLFSKTKFINHIQTVFDRDLIYDNQSFGENIDNPYFASPYDKSFWLRKWKIFFGNI